MPAPQEQNFLPSIDSLKDMLKRIDAERRVFREIVVQFLRAKIVQASADSRTIANLIKETRTGLKADVLKSRLKKLEERVTTLEKEAAVKDRIIEQLSQENEEITTKYKNVSAELKNMMNLESDTKPITMSSQIIAKSNMSNVMTSSSKKETSVNKNRTSNLQLKKTDGKVDDYGLLKKTDPPTNKASVRSSFGAFK